MTPGVAVSMNILISTPLRLGCSGDHSAECQIVNIYWAPTMCQVPIEELQHYARLLTSLSVFQEAIVAKQSVQTTEL